MALRVVMVMAALVAPIYCYSTGAPPDVCGDMTPKHGVDAKTGKSPYDLYLSKSSIRAGDTVEVTIKGRSAADTFKGLLVQARVGHDLVGRFIVPANSPYVQTLDCPNGQANAVTHKKVNGAGPNSVTFTWQAPRDYSAEVKFRYTVALNGGTFWVGEESQPLHVH